MGGESKRKGPRRRDFCRRLLSTFEYHDDDLQQSCPRDNYSAAIYRRKMSSLVPWVATGQVIGVGAQHVSLFTQPNSLSAGSKIAASAGWALRASQYMGSIHLDESIQVAQMGRIPSRISSQHLTATHYG
jgi:hypothetical protein